METGTACDPLYAQSHRSKVQHHASIIKFHLIVCMFTFLTWQSYSTHPHPVWLWAQQCAGPVSLIWGRGELLCEGGLSVHKAGDVTGGIYLIHTDHYLTHALQIGGGGVGEGPAVCVCGVCKLNMRV